METEMEHLEMVRRKNQHLEMVPLEKLVGENSKMGDFAEMKRVTLPILRAMKEFIGVFNNKPESQASSSKITIPYGMQEVADLEMGFTPAEIQPPEVPPNSGSGITLRDYLSCDYLSLTTKAKRFKPHQPRPSENAEPEPEPELEPPHDDDHGQVKEIKGSSNVKLATQMVLPAAVGWGGYFVIGQGALYNPAFAFSVCGVHSLGILFMFFGWYLETKNPRVSEFMQKLGQGLCIACLILTQIPVSNKLKY